MGNSAVAFKLLGNNKTDCDTDFIENKEAGFQFADVVFLTL